MYEYPTTDPVSLHHSSLPPVVGVNHYLISVCLEYLHQPVALKEEGLFRVPGDNSLMRSLHKDFQSGSVSKEQLRLGEEMTCRGRVIRYLYASEEQLR